MPRTANALPVWLNDGDRLLTRAREHRERFESAGDAMHLDLARRGGAKQERASKAERSR